MEKTAKEQWPNYICIVLSLEIRSSTTVFAFKQQSRQILFVRGQTTSRIRSVSPFRCSFNSRSWNRWVDINKAQTDGCFELLLHLALMHRINAKAISQDIHCDDEYSDRCYSNNGDISRGSRNGLQQNRSTRCGLTVLTKIAITQTFTLVAEH